MSATFITFEQASNLQVLEPVALQYEQRLSEIFRYFAKNTAAQMYAMDTYMQIIELLPVYSSKDYSNYLFSKTEEVFDFVDANLDHFNELKQQFQVMAKFVSEHKHDDLAK
jgi:hypothetical protein